MCRLFGMQTGANRSAATFWLLDAPDSLRDQGAINNDGTGLGWFDADARPCVDKQPIAAPGDVEFARAATTVTSSTFVAHVRLATTGRNTLANTHPFEQEGRLLAHNGCVLDLDVLEARLVELGTRDLVLGDTDSERVFALITGEARRLPLDQAIPAALRWLGENCRILAVNLVLITAEELYAVRWPSVHPLWIWEQTRVRPTPQELTSSRLAVTAPGTPAVVIATERMADDGAWRLLGDGEVLRVGADLTVRTIATLPPPARPVPLAQVEAMAAGAGRGDGAPPPRAT